MPDPRPTGDRTPAQRTADHASLARLSESLVPALVQKLSSSGLGELEVREGDWRIRLRRATPPAAGPARRTERPRLVAHGDRDVRPDHDARVREASGAAAAFPAPQPAVPPGPTLVGPRRTMVASPTVGLFRAEATAGTRVRAGDRIASVDLLGIGQDVVAPIDGLLVEVFAQSGEAVEYGEEVAVVESDVAVETEAPAGDGTGMVASSGVPAVEDAGEDLIEDVIEDAPAAGPPDDDEPAPGEATA